MRSCLISVVSYINRLKLCNLENTFSWGGGGGGGGWLFSQVSHSCALQLSHSWQSSFLGSSECVNRSCDHVY